MFHYNNDVLTTRPLQLTAMYCQQSKQLCRCFAAIWLKNTSLEGILWRPIFQKQMPEKESSQNTFRVSKYCLMKLPIRTITLSKMLYCTFWGSQIISLALEVIDRFFNTFWKFVWIKNWIEVRIIDINVIDNYKLKLFDFSIEKSFFFSPFKFKEWHIF